MRYLLSAIWRLYFHPAKFDNFKDEKMSDYKTVSVAQSKKMLDWKPASLINYGLLLRAVLFLCFLGQFFSLNIVASTLKSCIKWSFKKNMLFFLNLIRNFKLELSPLLCFHLGQDHVSSFRLSGSPSYAGAMELSSFYTVQSRFSDIKFSDNLWFSDYFSKTIL